MTRFFDILLSLIGIILLFPFFFTIFIISWFKNKSPLFLQIRIGKNMKPFKLIKFRTMPKDTKSMATHLIKFKKLDPYFNFLRKSKLDEIPQLFNVLKGDMSLVGPRPCLFNQKKLISERSKKKIFRFKPGITGLAQIQGITMSTPTLLAKTDYQMVKNNINIFNYFNYIFLTFKYYKY